MLRELTNNHHEPYREYLRDVRRRLKLTRDWAEAKVDNSNQTDEKNIDLSTQYIANEDIYLYDHELLEPLQLIYDSLVDCDMQEIADGSLSTIMRRISCFGMTLLKLDIRQDSSRHCQAINEITDYLGIKINGLSYKDWPEVDKQQFLLEEISNLRPLIPTDFPASDEVQEVLDTFKLLSQQPPSALGAYIISMATHPSDVLAVRLLQLENGCKNPQRIVPLFETLSDLEGAAKTIDNLLSIDAYKSTTNGHQEVMIGYSDSAKDAGFFAASWGQFRAQEAINQRVIY
jgi:phosphoenolpyruvate carboxylase